MSTDDTATLWTNGLQPDLDPGQRRIGGTEAKAHRIARRLVTRRALLPYSPEVGRDLRDYLEGDEDEGVIASEITAEAEAVDGVISVDVTVTKTAGAVAIAIVADTDDGEVRFTLDITQAGTAFTFES